MKRSRHHRPDGRPDRCTPWRCAAVATERQACARLTLRTADQIPDPVLP